MMTAFSRVLIVSVRDRRERERRAGLAGIGAIIKHFFPYGVQ